MWRRSISRTSTFSNNPAICTFVQRWMNNNNNNVTFNYSIRRFLASNASGCTVGDVIDQWSHRFETKGIPEPVESIQHIVAHITGTKKIMDLANIKNDRLSAGQIEKLESLCEHRLSRMPLQYIIGEWNFHDITLKLVPPIFVPWPETEMFVDVVLKRVNSFPADTCEMLELCCGSGAISLALAHACKKIKCIAIDINPDACGLTMTNMNRLNLGDRIEVMHATLKSDDRIEVSSNFNGTGDVDLNSRLFDFIVSNPPYQSAKQMSELQQEMKSYQDLRALDGGEDGLDIIKPLLRYAAKALKPGGRLFLEVDPAHPEHIQRFTNKHSDLKLQHEHTYKDYRNKDRYVELLKIT